MSPPAPGISLSAPNGPKHYRPWGNAPLSTPDCKAAGATGLWGGQVSEGNNPFPQPGRCVPS